MFTLIYLIEQNNEQAVQGISGFNTEEETWEYTSMQNINMKRMKVVNDNHLKKVDGMVKSYFQAYDEYLKVYSELPDELHWSKTDDHCLIAVRNVEGLFYKLTKAANKHSWAIGAFVQLKKLGVIPEGIKWNKCDLDWSLLAFELY